MGGWHSLFPWFCSPGWPILPGFVVLLYGKGGVFGPAFDFSRVLVPAKFHPPPSNSLRAAD
jgi:hypothetical protein